MSLTREKILELGEELLLTKGYNAFSYHDISKKLGIKNAAVHYYFPAKENLVTSIVKNNILRFEEMVDNMNTRKFDEINQLKTFLKIYAKSNREEKICLFGSLGSDFQTLSEATQVELQKMMDLIITWLADILETGKTKGFFKFNCDATNKASLLLSNLVAGLQMSRINSKNDFKIIQTQIIEDLIP
jgi:TetR/AcrR family transcriptional regulator, transcriptional repressor for nem operon